MRSFLLLFSFVALSMAVVIQKREVRGPWDDPAVAEGSLCFPCRKIVERGESMGIDYNAQWLTTEIATHCKNLGGFAQDCRMWFKAEFDVIDQAIQHGTTSHDICLKVRFCRS